MAFAEHCQIFIVSYLISHVIPVLLCKHVGNAGDTADHSLSCTVGPWTPHAMLFEESLVVSDVSVHCACRHLGNAGEAAVHLLSRLLAFDPTRRCPADEGLAHEYLASFENLDPNMGRSHDSHTQSQRLMLKC